MNKFIITSGAVVFDEQKRILLKREPYRGWELPGGVVVREVKEETGINIDIISQELRRNICNIWWLGIPINGSLKTSKESLEVGFFSVEDALKLIENEYFKEELLKCLDKEHHPFFISL
ncbi:NUDIX hydrolase [Lysinibacillus fusiformis]|uniref:NUDIX hydrolase n=1 Tax=Lysinibacillus fusiformis TaxID=28031 RepID=UPI00301B4619